MPIYEYTCRACGEDTERLQKLSEPDLVECPSCGKPEMQRRVSAAGFRLSGSGWYETDFKKDGKRNLSGDSSQNSDKSSGEGSDGGKSDSKASSESGKSKSKSSEGSANKGETSKKSESKSDAKPAKAAKQDK